QFISSRARIHWCVVQQPRPTDLLRIHAPVYRRRVELVRGRWRSTGPFAAEHPLPAKPRRRDTARRVANDALYLPLPTKDQEVLKCIGRHARAEVRNQRNKAQIVLMLEGSIGVWKWRMALVHAQTQPRANERD